jgi:hypothetical protein
MHNKVKVCKLYIFTLKFDCFTALFEQLQWDIEPKDTLVIRGLPRAFVRIGMEKFLSWTNLQKSTLALLIQFKMT